MSRAPLLVLVSKLFAIDADFELPFDSVIELKLVSNSWLRVHPRPFGVHHPDKLVFERGVSIDGHSRVSQLSYEDGNNLTSSCVHLVPCFFPNIGVGFPIIVPDVAEASAGAEVDSFLTITELLLLLLLLLELLVLEDPTVGRGFGSVLLLFDGFCCCCCC